MLYEDVQISKIIYNKRLVKRQPQKEVNSISREIIQNNIKFVLTVDRYWNLIDGYLYLAALLKAGKNKASNVIMATSDEHECPLVVKKSQILEVVKQITP